MKKIIISNYDDIKNPFYGGGGANAVFEIAKRLSKKYKVIVICGKFPKSKNEVIDKVTYKRIGSSLFGPRVAQLTFYFSLFYYFLICDFDLWIESLTPPFSTNFLQLFSKKPVIGLVHMLSGEDMKRKYKIPFNLVEKVGIKTYKYIIVTSEAVKKQIQKDNPKANIRIISNGIDHVTFSNSKPISKKAILFLGRVEVDQKGLDLLIEAYAKIANFTDYELWIAGWGSSQEINKLKKIISTYRLENKIKLLGKVVGKEKEKLFSNAILTVISSRFETFSTVALESMHRGVPIIYFDIENLSWIPKNAGLKVKPFSAKDLSKKILSLSKNSELRKKMGNEGKKFAQSKTWDFAFREYQDFIDLIFGGKTKYGAA